jgi:hypothetical protein
MLKLYQCHKSYSAICANFNQSTELLLLFFYSFMFQLLNKKQEISRKQATGGVKKAEFLG